MGLNKKRNTKYEILQFATKLFIEKGYTSAYTTSIANELGISPGNLTFHFPTKEHILAELICWSGRKSNGGKLPQVVITVADTITYQSGPVNMCFEYKELTGTVRLKHSYKLRFTDRRGILLCPVGFVKGTFEEFKQFLREKRPDLVIPE